MERTPDGVRYSSRGLSRRSGRVHPAGSVSPVRPEPCEVPSMPTLHVCPLSRLHDTVAETRASHVVTLINVGSAAERPPAIAPERHLFIGVSDIVEPMDGHVLAMPAHVERL